MKAISLAVALFFAIPSLALATGVVYTSTVDFIGLGSSGLGYVNFTSALQGTPASCGSSYTHALAFDTSTVGGKALYSMALAAKTFGYQIYAAGTGACGILGVVEDWTWGELHE